MQTIAIISQKGGAGKTTLAVHLAVASAASGQNTAIMDLDPQASAARWSDRREAELPVVISAQAARLPIEKERVRENGGDILFIDTAPHADSVAVSAARAADLVIVPCRPAILDVEAAVTTIDLIRMTDTPVIVVLAAVPYHGGEADEAQSVLRDFGVPVCPARMGNRIAFSRSLTFGQVAQETDPGTKAAQEIEHVHDFMRAQLNVCTRSDAQPPTKETLDHVRDTEQVRRSA